jgi:serine/threonine protein kinase
MADIGNDDGWHLVLAHPAIETREQKQIKEWEDSKGHWSGLGKHVTNFCDHKKLHVSQETELGSGSYGSVERITYQTVTMARKYVKPRRGIKVETLRAEANSMERLVHRHILKLVGTYTLHQRNALYILLYPAAVCDLSRFLDDIDGIRLDTCDDREDAFKRLRLLGLEEIGTVEESAVATASAQSMRPDNVSSAHKSVTALCFLQQILGCITEAVAFFHKEGVRHRDLKPKNILLSPGRVYLADFGIARDVRDCEDRITSSGGGSKYWSAPEVAHEQDHSMSSADIYSLGCIFLTIATVLYGETLETYEKVMKEPSWTEKYEKLPKYLQELTARAAKAKLSDDTPDFNVKHTLGLVECMLKYEPHERPTAVEINARLSELGGLEQRYHLSCCHKSKVDITKVINKRLKSLHDKHTSSLNRITQLEALNAENQKRLAHLQSVHGTWEQRIENERKHAGKQYEALLEKYNREVSSRQSLEQRLKALECEAQNRSHRPQRNKNKSILNGAGNGHLAKFNGGRGGGGNGELIPNCHKRSLVPRPSRPTTPIRPAFGRDPGSNSSTLASSTHSTFSKASVKTNESASSVSSGTLRSVSPESPTREKAPISPILMNRGLPASSVLMITQPSTRGETRFNAPRPSWANMAAKAISSLS